MKKLIFAATAAALLAVPAAAGAHATVNAMQPQGKSLTSARQLYVVRVPSEREKTDTYQVSMFVPPAVQQSIRVMKKPGWRITLAKKDTGIKSPEGEAVFAIEKITWTAVRRSSAIEPLHFDDFPVRWQNPAAPQRTCFWIYQTYGNRKGSRWDRVETVKWSGASTSETPASCVSFTES
jgi:uncharacterized protein YcnI